MKTLSMAVAALACVFAFGISSDAEAAKRLGGGKSVGMQKQMSGPDRGAAPAAAPAAPGTAAKAAAPAAAAPAAAAASTGRSWMGPVAGLAAGLGLAALASHFGFGEELASFMLMALVAVVVLAAVGFFLRRRAGSAGSPTPALAGAGRHEYSGAPQNAGRPAFDVAMPGSSAAPAAAAPAANAAIPAGFDVTGFLRSAKVHFIRLQAANDAANLNDLREFTTPEMFAELKMDIDERGPSVQATDVVNVDAQLLEVIEESSRYVASVRFEATIREGANAPVEAVSEVWHLVKSRDGGGWLLAGIQQLA